MGVKTLKDYDLTRILVTTEKHGGRFIHAPDVNKAAKYLIDERLGEGDWFQYKEDSMFDEYYSTGKFYAFLDKRSHCEYEDFYFTYLENVTLEQETH